MSRVNLNAIPELAQRSPTGKFHSYCRNVSVALGAARNVGTWGGGHPFDVQVRRVPPGAAVCPHHAHAAQWELFVVRRGAGTVRVGDERHPVAAGDCFVHPPGEAHQLINSDAEDLEVLILADNPALDAFWYPDSQKWGLRPPHAFFRATAVDYFEGEDTVADPPATLALPAPATPFASRRVRLADLAWEDWSSPRGKFRASSRAVSAALGAVPRAPLTQGGQPFDLEFAKVPAGAAVCPHHWHGLQWEFYLFLEGAGEFRLGEERFAVGPGDAVMAAPFVAHSFRNTAETDLHYLCVADNPPADYWFYPDSGKYGFSRPRQFFRPAAADYFDGEE